NHEDLSIQISVNNNFVELYSYYHNHGLHSFSRTFKDEQDDYINYSYDYNETTNQFVEKHYRDGILFYSASQMMDLDTYFQTYSHQAIFNIGIDFNYLDQMVVERPPINFGITLRDVNMTFKYHPLIYLETEISTYEITLTEGYFGF